MHGSVGSPQLSCVCTADILATCTAVSASTWITKRHNYFGVLRFLFLNDNTITKDCVLLKTLTNNHILYKLKCITYIVHVPAEINYFLFPVSSSETPHARKSVNTPVGNTQSHCLFTNKITCILFYYVTPSPQFNCGLAELTGVVISLFSSVSSVLNVSLFRLTE